MHTLPIGLCAFLLGVDVDGSDAPLEVRRWPQNRVNGLLDRTGR